MIDYNITPLLTFHLMKKLKQFKDEKYLKIIVRLSLPEDHVLNLLLRHPAAQGYQDRDKITAKIKEQDVNVIVTMINYDFKTNQEIDKKEICLP